MFLFIPLIKDGILPIKTKDVEKNQKILNQYLINANMYYNQIEIYNKLKQFDLNQEFSQISSIFFKMFVFFKKRKTLHNILKITLYLK